MIYVCMYVGRYVCMYVFKCKYICVCIYIYMYTCDKYIDIYIYVRR